MERQERRRRSRAGFTMVELSLAITVLLIAIMATFTTQLSSQNLMRTSQETNAAVMDLQAAMEEILLSSADAIPVAGGPFAPGQPIAAFNDLNLRNERIVPTYPGYAGAGPVPDPLTIQLTLTWTDFGGRPRAVELTSMKVR